MTRSHGRCAKGARLRMGYRHGHRKTTPLVADGVMYVMTEKTLYALEPKK